MAIQLSLRSGTLTAMLEGEIDHHTARELREEIDSAASRTKPKRLILDFSKIRFMDSSGVGLILGRYRLVSQWGGELCVANLSPNLERIVSLAGLKEICTVYRREENEQESNQ
jgi:stage II sporulation protein AA (anti-sigma F factor antagonist)